MAKPLHPPPPVLSRDGVSLTVAKTRRNLPEALSPQIKSTNFLNNILAKRESIAAGTFDSLFLNWNEELTECTISNLFFISDGTVLTPALDCGILDGITRTIVMTLAQEEGLSVREGHYYVADLQRAEECFLSNTSMEIMPVSRVDSFAIGDGKPGPLTRRLQTRFADSAEPLLRMVLEAENKELLEENKKKLAALIES